MSSCGNRKIQGGSWPTLLAHGNAHGELASTQKNERQAAPAARDFFAWRPSGLHAAAGVYFHGIRHLPSVGRWFVVAGLALWALWAVAGPQPVYPWLSGAKPPSILMERIEPPDGYGRAAVAEESFGWWLRRLPLKADNPPVRLFDGSLKLNQAAHYAVVQMDVGRRDLQQCADAILRLRAEYLYSLGKLDAIQFRFTSGDLASYRKWIAGFRPRVQGNRVTWLQTGASGDSYKAFRGYLRTLFTYAGTASMSRDLEKVDDWRVLGMGDVIVEPGYPGHAVLVLDLARHWRTGERVFLLGQSYMPAQEFEVLKNPVASSLSPWYSLEFGETLRTPEWVFRGPKLRRFRD